MTDYKTRNELLTLVPKKCKFLELGVFRGEFAKEILKIVEPSEFYLVDIWTGKAGSGDKDGANYVEVSDMKNVYLNLIHQTSTKPNIHVIRCDSVGFLQSCDNEFFDAIYVDADHSEQAVYDDMVNSFRVIKNDGYLMGHDYHHQIKVAVDRFCVDYQQNITHITEDGCPSFSIKIKK
jgi:hypothetical protein